jgi:hypothetical protein
MKSQLEIENRIEKLIKFINKLEQKNEDMIIESDDYINGGLSTSEYDLLTTLNTELDTLWWVLKE